MLVSNEVKKERLNAERVNQGLVSELEEKQVTPKTALIAQKILWHLSLIDKGQTKTKKAIRQELGICEGQTSSVNYNSLNKAYWALSGVLNKKYVLEAKKTSFERDMAGKVRHYTRTKFYQSIWISNHNIDLFFPQLRLAIEINGGIHNNEIKMRKGELKDATLQTLKIRVANIDNENTNKLTYEIIGHIKSKNIKPIGTLNIRRLWSKIFTVTLARHHSIAELSEIFGYDFQKLSEIIEANRGIK
ncbi:MAG: hypothetical protein WCQ47_07885 [bacterium]